VDHFFLNISKSSANNTVTNYQMHLLLTTMGKDKQMKYENSLASCKLEAVLLSFYNSDILGHIYLSPINDFK